MGWTGGCDADEKSCNQDSNGEEHAQKQCNSKLGTPTPPPSPLNAKQEEQKNEKPMPKASSGPQPASQNGSMKDKLPMEQMDKVNGNANVVTSNTNGHHSNGKTDMDKPAVVTVTNDQRDTEEDGQKVPPFHTNGSTVLIVKATNGNHQAKQFDNPAYDPEGQGQQYENGDGVKSVYKERDYNKKDLPHKVTFTEAKGCNCRRIILIIVILAILVGLAVGGYFLYKHLTKPKTNTVRSQLTIENMEYTSQLADVDSKAYTSLEEDLLYELTKLFHRNQLGTDFQECIIEKFSPGSVVVQFLTIYNNDYDAPQLEEKVKKIVESGLLNNPDGTTKLGGTNHIVNRASIKTEAVLDQAEKSLPTPDSKTAATTTTTTTSETTTLSSTSTLETTPSSLSSTATAPSSTTSTSRSTSGTSTISPTNPSTTTIKSIPPPIETDSTTDSTTTSPSTTVSTTTPTTPSTVTTVPTTIPTTVPACRSIGIEECQNSQQVPYNLTTFPNYMGSLSEESAASDLAEVLRAITSGCHPYVQRLACSIIFPECLPGDAIVAVPPCKNFCESVQRKCASHLSQTFKDKVECDRFPEDQSTCLGAPPLSPYQIRIRDGAGPFEGRVEINQNGEWGTICDDGFDDKDAIVICRQLGYRRGGLARHRSYFTDGSGPIWLKNLECEGDEEHLAQCRHSSFTPQEHNCQHSEDIAVTCTTDPGSQVVEVRTRLVGGNTQDEGYVEVFYKGKWGTVCDDHFGEAEARTVCKSLGYNDTSQAQVLSNSRLTPSSTDTHWLDNVSCDVNSTSIALCNHDPWGSHDCSLDHSEDVAVSCLTQTTTSTTATTIPTSTETTRQSSPVMTTTQTTRPILITTEPPVIVRLINGPDGLHGLLQVYHEDQWGNVCDDQFDIDEAQVVCRSLGYVGEDILSSTETAHQEGDFIWLDELKCKGDESNLGYCQHDEWGTHDCSASEAVSVYCGQISTTIQTTIPTSASTTPVPEVAVYLVDGGDSLHGRLIVSYNGVNGTVCDDNFDERDARVVCRMLNYTGEDVTVEDFGEHPLNIAIHLDELECTGEETSIAACGHDGWGENDCSHREDVGVGCGRPKTTTIRITTTTPIPSTTTQVLKKPDLEYDLRLTGGRDVTEGLLEVQYNTSTWLPACIQGFTTMQASIFCNKAFGLRESPVPIPAAPFMNATIQASMTCDNTSCPISGWQLGDPCSLDDTVAINCAEKRARIVPGGQEDNLGRLEVFYNGSWGTVCDDAFDHIDAKVACQMIGYNGSARAKGQAEAAEESVPILLDDLECVGSETSLFQCPHVGIKNSNCGHNEDVQIKCMNIPQIPTPLPTRLVGGSHPMEGRLEVQYEGQWGTICPILFELADAQVACRYLNASGPARIITAFDWANRRGSGPIWLRNIECTGEESSLADCYHDNWGDTDGCQHVYDIVISCEDPPTTTMPPTTSTTTPTSTSQPTTTLGPVPTRLLGSPLSSEGRIQLYYNGSWGTVCKDDFGRTEVDVVCKGLGFNDTSAFEMIRYNNFEMADESSVPIWLDNIHCQGLESDLGHCDHRGWGEHNCAHHEDVAVRCAPVNVSRIAYRLVEGSHSGQGRVEVRYAERWGTLCNSGFDGDSATVLCGMLGFSKEGAEEVDNNEFGVGSGPIWLTQFRCFGDEVSILECGPSDWGDTSRCTHSEDVAISCQNATQATSSTMAGTRGIPSTTMASPACETIEIENCRSILPYSTTLLPNSLGHTTQAQVIQALEEFDWLQMISHCQSEEFAKFICSLYLPSCEEMDQGGVMKYRKGPCQSLCTRSQDACLPQFGADFTWQEAWSCENLPVSSPTDTTQCYDADSQVGPGQCERIVVPFCSHDLPYTMTSFPNTREHHTQQQATLASSVWLGVANTQCHPKLRRLVCDVFTPECPSAGALTVLPCASVCREVKTACESELPSGWPLDFDCFRFPDDQLGMPCNRLDIPTTTSPAMTSSTMDSADRTTNVTTTRADGMYTNVTSGMNTTKTKSTTPSLSTMDINSTVAESTTQVTTTSPVTPIPQENTTTVFNMTKPYSTTPTMTTLEVNTTTVPITMTTKVNETKDMSTKPTIPVQVMNTTASQANTTTMSTTVAVEYVSDTLESTTTFSPSNTSTEPKSTDTSSTTTLSSSTTTSTGLVANLTTTSLPDATTNATGTTPYSSSTKGIENTTISFSKTKPDESTTVSTTTLTPSTTGVMNITTTLPTGMVPENQTIPVKTSTLDQNVTSTTPIIPVTVQTTTDTFPDRLLTSNATVPDITSAKAVQSTVSPSHPQVSGVVDTTTESLNVSTVSVGLRFNETSPSSLSDFVTPKANLSASTSPTTTTTVSVKTSPEKQTVESTTEKLNTTTISMSTTSASQSTTSKTTEPVEQMSTTTDIKIPPGPISTAARETTTTTEMVTTTLPEVQNRTSMATTVITPVVTSETTTETTSPSKPSTTTITTQVKTSPTTSLPSTTESTTAAETTAATSPSTTKSTTTTSMKPTTSISSTASTTSVMPEMTRSTTLDVIYVEENDTKTTTSVSLESTTTTESPETTTSKTSTTVPTASMPMSTSSSTSTTEEAKRTEPKVKAENVTAEHEIKETTTLSSTTPLPSTTPEASTVTTSTRTASTTTTKPMDKMTSEESMEPSTMASTSTTTREPTSPSKSTTPTSQGTSEAATTSMAATTTMELAATSPTISTTEKADKSKVSTTEIQNATTTTETMRVVPDTPRNKTNSGRVGTQGNSSAYICEAMNTSSTCNGAVDYSSVTFPNYFNHTSQSQAMGWLNNFMLPVNTACGENLKKFVCSLVLPKCEDGTLIMPCRTLCRTVTRSCSAALESVGFNLPFTCNSFSNKRRQCYG